MTLRCIVRARPSGLSGQEGCSLSFGITQAMPGSLKQQKKMFHFHLLLTLDGIEHKLLRIEFRLLESVPFAIPPFRHCSVSTGFDSVN